MAQDLTLSEQIYVVLLAAFPKTGELARLVRFGLDKNLEEIAGGESLADVLFNLLTWAEAQGRLADLLKKASELNPGNNALQEVLAYLPTPPQPRSAFFKQRDRPAPPVRATEILPSLPQLVLGRDPDLYRLKLRLGILTADAAPASTQALTAVHGWPGVGKTTLAAILAHDPDVRRAFPDGVLWASLGPHPALLAQLLAWGRALGNPTLNDAQSVEEASTSLAALLWSQQRLLIVDDAWEPDHVRPFAVGGRGCALLLTTREPQVAQAVAPAAASIYRLNVLDDDVALELLRTLAPTVVDGAPIISRDLVQELEGLPLALQVAGRLLNTEASYGFGVEQLLVEIREGAKLLETQAPANRPGVTYDTTLTVAALLQKSTDRLEATTRDCFALLGAFAPKPATFDEAAMRAVWGIADARPAIRTLVNRGLLEPIDENRFWMHALLVKHADSLLTN